MATQMPSSTEAMNRRAKGRIFRVIPFVFLALSIDTPVVRGQESKTDQEKAIAAARKAGRARVSGRDATRSAGRSASADLG